MRKMLKYIQLRILPDFVTVPGDYHNPVYEAIYNIPELLKTGSSMKLDDRKKRIADNND